MNNELKNIKKLYGEEMMHLCRELFPSILEKEGLLLSILQKNLAPTHFFASDIKENELYEEFKSWIYSLIDVEKEHQIITNKTPFELMDDAGYILYECKSEEDIQRFKKYYASNEELCTFRGGRLNRCYVFFAVKKNVDEIKRENFKNPKRQDEYGTSVISIQFSKGKATTLSIKNRYNHTVNNPDATFSNNLENIIPGLTKSFEKYLGFKLNKQVSHQEDFLTDDLYYVHANDGKYYRYNIERNGIYYCENNILVKDGEVIAIYANNPERYILINQYILDLKKRKIISFDSNDAFIKSVNDVGEINKIDVLKNKENGTKLITIYYKDNKQVKIGINKENDIIQYENNYIDEIGDNFLRHNEILSSISLLQVRTIGDSFLWGNEQLSNISLPHVQKIGNSFLRYNHKLSSIELPQVQKIGNGFLCLASKLSSISLPQVRIIGNNFLSYNQQLSSIELPKVQIIGLEFLMDNEQLSSISLPQVQIIGDRFLCHNIQLSNIELPKVQIIGDNFLYTNEHLSSISLSHLQEIGDRFLCHNIQLSNIELPKVQIIGDDFLFCNKKLSSIALPHVQKIGDYFLRNNEQLSSISLPQVQTIGDDFLCINEQLSSILLPQVQTIGDDFLYTNEQLSNISLPHVQKIGVSFLLINYIINKEKILEEMEKRNAQANNQRNK